MTTEQLLAKFNPQNASNLTPTDLEIMRGLTDQQIDALANAYPNQPTRRPYLRLYDTTKAENKQLFNLSTWQNLRNVRKFSNLKNLVPYDFVNTPASFQQQRTTPISRLAAGKSATSPKKVIVDLSATEAAAELKASVEKKTMIVKSVTNVENKTKPAAPAKAEKQAKPASSNKKAAPAKAKPEAAKVVENAGADGSEQFAPVE